MDIFIDTLDLTLIKKYNDMGILAGVTTNPTMARKFGMQNDLDMVLKLREVIGGGEIHVEAFGETADEILSNSDRLLSTGKNLVFKIPFSEAGVHACNQLQKMGYKTNMHLVFSVSQAMLAAVVKANYICTLVGRIDDISYSASNNVEGMVGLGPKLMISSVRHPQHVILAQKIGADAITIPPNVLELMFKHPLTDKAIDIFKKDIIKPKS